MEFIFQTSPEHRSADRSRSAPTPAALIAIFVLMAVLPGTAAMAAGESQSLIESALVEVARREAGAHTRQNGGMPRDHARAFRADRDGRAADRLANMDTPGHSAAEPDGDGPRPEAETPPPDRENIAGRHERAVRHWRERTLNLPPPSAAV